MVNHNHDNETNNSENNINLEDDAPITTQYSLQCNWIKKIMRDTFKKLRLMSHLPTLLKNNGEILKCYLPPLEVNFILALFSKYGVVEPPIITEDITQITNPLDKLLENKCEKPEAKDMKKIYNIYLAHAIDIIFRSKFLVNILKCVPCEVDPSYDKLLYTFYELMQYNELKLNATLPEENLKEAYMKNRNLNQDIDEFEDLLYRQKSEVSRLYDFYDKKMNKIKNEFEKVSKNFEQTSENLQNTNEKKMEEESANSEKNCLHYKRSADMAVQSFNNLVQNHLTEEKKLGQKHLKLEQQIESWINKFDKDIGEKQADFDELDTEYKDLQARRDLLQEKILIQQEEWIMAMEEKEQFAEQQFNERLYLFVANRAARIIQKAWRAYWKKIKKYRKKKKGKGKTKKK